MLTAFARRAISAAEGVLHDRHHLRRRLHRGLWSGRRHIGLPAGGGRRCDGRDRPRRVAADGASGVRWPSLRDRRRLPRAADGRRAVGAPAGSTQSRSSTSGSPMGGSAGRASRLHLHFDHREAGDEPSPFGWMVEATGPPSGTECPCAGDGASACVRPRRGDGRPRRGWRAGAHRRRPLDRLPAGDRRRGPQLAVARRRRHSGHPARLQPDRHRLRHQP